MSAHITTNGSTVQIHITPKNSHKRDNIIFVEKGPRVRKSKKVQSND